MIPILISYLLWLPAVIGLGTVVFAVWPRAVRDSDPSLSFIVTITGFAALGAAANALNFFMPIDPTVAECFLAGGWIVFLLRIRLICTTALSAWPGSSLSFAAFLLLVLASMAYFSRQSALPYDTGLYHLQTIEWLTQSRLPAGLANLHGRLGFNSIWFSVAAALEIPHMEGRSSFVVNSLPFAMYGVAAGTATVRTIARELRPSSVFLASTCSAWLWNTHSEFIGSPSPEIPVLLLGLMSVFTAIRALESTEHQFFYVFLGVAIAMFAITIKLSALPVLLAPAISITWIILRHRHIPPEENSNPGRLVVATAAAAVALVLPWVFRSIMLSGSLAYPIRWATLGFLDWTVTPSQIDAESRWIMSWARQPGLPPDVVLANWNWLRPWLGTLTSNATTRLVAVLALGGFILWGVAGAKNIRRRDLEAYLISGLAPLMGIVFWFSTAPDLRFGIAYIWSLGLLCLSIGVHRFYVAHRMTGQVTRWIVVGSVPIIVAIFGFVSLRSYGSISTQALMNWPAIPTIEVKRNITKDGFRIFSPASGDQCWNAALPCTPYFDAGLEVLLGEDGRPVEFRASRRP